MLQLCTMWWYLAWFNGLQLHRQEGTFIHKRHSAKSKHFTWVHATESLASIKYTMTPWSFPRCLTTAKSLAHTFPLIHWFRWESEAGRNLLTHPFVPCGIMDFLKRAVHDMAYCILNSPPIFHELLKDSSIYARQKGQINTQQDFIKTNQNFPQKGIFFIFSPYSFPSSAPRFPKRQMSLLVTSLASQISNTQTHPGHRWIRMGSHITGSAGSSRLKAVRVCFSL